MTPSRLLWAWVRLVVNNLTSPPKLVEPSAFCDDLIFRAVVDPVLAIFDRCVAADHRGTGIVALLNQELVLEFHSCAIVVY